MEEVDGIVLFGLRGLGWLVPFVLKLSSIMEVFEGN